MTKQSPENTTSCPNCGGVVTYRGVGRRPVWCSTRCRNEASLARYAARRAGVEVKVVEVFRRRTTSAATAADATPGALEPEGPIGEEAWAPTPTTEQALRVIQNDPLAVGRLLARLERRRVEGAITTPDWLPVRNGLRLIVRGISPDLERP